MSDVVDVEGVKGGGSEGAKSLDDKRLCEDEDDESPS